MPAFTSTGGTVTNTTVGAGSVTHVASSGTLITALATQDSAYAQALNLAFDGSNPFSGYSQNLDITNFGFATTSAALGVVASVRRYSTLTGDGTHVRDVTIQLIKSGTAQGTNKAATGTNWPTSSGAEATVTYGTTSDLWGLTLSSAEMNASNFGIRICYNTDATIDGPGTGNGFINIVTLQVTTAAGSHMGMFFGFG